MIVAFVMKMFLIIILHVLKTVLVYGEVLLLRMNVIYVMVMVFVTVVMDTPAVNVAVLKDKRGIV